MLASSPIGTIWRIVLCLCIFSFPLTSAHAADSLIAHLRSRGELNCGVSDNIPGFAAMEAAGTWRGIEADFCRALAAAVLGDANAVSFVPLTASKRFPALQADRVDVLLATTSWTLSREALLGVRFAAPIFHDGQGFLVRAASPAMEPRDLLEGAVCVERDTTHAARLRDYSAANGGSVEVIEADSAQTAAADFFAGRCAALCAESAQLAALRVGVGVPGDYRILPDTISREVLSAVVRTGDPNWETAVRWVAFALVLAEEYGLDRAAASRVTDSGQPGDYARAWGVPQVEEYALVARTLGVEPGWLTRAVAAVGNYRELFDRNLGKDSPLQLERGPNRLWNEGGLLFAPPLR